MQSNFNFYTGVNPLYAGIQNRTEVHAADEQGSQGSQEPIPVDITPLHLTSHSILSSRRHRLQSPISRSNLSEAEIQKQSKFIQQLREQLGADLSPDQSRHE